MYWLIVAALVILNMIAALWTVTGIRRERAGYRESAEKKNSRRGRRAADEARKGYRDGASCIPGKRRWKIILENISTREISEYIFYRSIGIGRAEKDTTFEDFISIPYDRKISKLHCSIMIAGNSLYLKDEGSTNHTYRNGRKIHKPEILKKGDVIGIGESEIRVVKIFREALQDVQ